MSLKLFNTMGRELQEFHPIQKSFVGFYGCGPTVYNYAHIGNLRAYVFLDILDRTLTFLGYEKKHVMNITDVGHLTGDADSGEDKMLKTAESRHESVMEVAKFYTDAFLSDIDKLNIIRPDVICKATEHIDDMINLIKRIEANGHTYMAGGNLYYDVSTYPDYGKLAGIDINDLKAGARIEIDKNKKSPYDFVLWFTKSKFENQALTWDSPWGRGYPGWHIECSAMSMKYLGEQFDIHTGGIDHIPIHHTNEIAQSEGATGKKWVNYWLHNEFLVVQKSGVSSTPLETSLCEQRPASDGKDVDKMSKSSGNFLRLQTLLDAGYDALDYRYFLLGGYYRKQIYFSYDAMDSAKNSRLSLLKKIVQLAKKAGGVSAFDEIASLVISTERERVEKSAFSDAALSHLNAFTASLENDLLTPVALSEISKVIKDNSIKPKEAISLIDKMDSVMGLRLTETAKSMLESEESESAISFSSENEDEKVEIDALIQKRAEAKKNKDFATADKIRDDLKVRGITIIDTPTGVTWKRV